MAMLDNIWNYAHKVEYIGSEGERKTTMAFGVTKGEALWRAGLDKKPIASIKKLKKRDDRI